MQGVPPQPLPMQGRRGGGGLSSGVGAGGVLHAASLDFFCPLGVFNRVQTMSADLKCAEVPLTQGRVALVDLCDFERMSEHKWHAVLCSGRWYARRSFKDGDRTVSVYMHRQILGLQGAEGDTVVDHISGDGLDNRRGNLRATSYSQNNLNQQSSRGRTGLRGVYLQGGRFMVRVAGEYVGMFESELEAAFEANAVLDRVSPGVGARNPVDKGALLALLESRRDALDAKIASVRSL